MKKQWLKELLPKNLVKITNYGDYEFMHRRRLLIAAVRLAGFSLQEIADHIGVSRQAVDQVCKKTGLKFEKYKALPRVFRNCTQCGKQIPRGGVVGIHYDSVHKSYQAKKGFCSIECRDTWDEADSVNHKWSRRWGIELTCKHCGKQFVRTKYLASIIASIGRCKNTYCSRECFLNSDSLPRMKKHEVKN